MRFLMLNWRDPHSPLAGGAERVSLAHLAHLVKRGHEVFWFANAFPGCQPEDAVTGIRIFRGGGRGTSILAARKWYRRQTPFDLVIDQHHGLPWFAPWWCHTPCVAYIHEVLGPIWKSFHRWPASAIGRRQERWTHWLYRRTPFWTVSESTAAQLRRHGVRQVFVFPNGIDPVALTELDDKPLAPPVRLMVVCRLAPNKRVDHAIRALKCLAEKGVEARLTIVGTGEAEAELKQLAERLQLREKILFTGKLAEPEKNGQLRRAHLLLHPSVREGWGLNVIEANAMGTPAIVYPVPGLIDSTISGQTGVVVNAETPEALAAGVADTLRQPELYQLYRQQALARARSLHWDNVLPATCDWLETIARQKPKAAG